MLNEFLLSDDEIAELLKAWPVGDFLSTRPGAGTASPAIIVVTEQGKFFLKQRNPRYCDPGQLAYDHSVIKHLADEGLPVIPPVLTSEGGRWVSQGERIYELYQYGAGEQFTPGSVAQLTAAGELLGRLHHVTADFAPDGYKPWPRFFNPADRLPEIAEARELLAEGGSTGEILPEEAKGLLDYLEEQARGVRQRVPDERYWSLPQVIVHGDYHPGNFKFAGDRVAGIFDFDWVARQPRLVDVVDGLIFFCSRRPQPLDPNDIWRLTQAFDPDWEWMRTFVRPYLETNEFTDEEQQCLPSLMRARWLYSRLDAMHRKIRRDDTLLYLLPQVDRPLRWLEENTPRLVNTQWCR